MRVLFGMILGAGLTVAAAYIHDMGAADPESATTAQQRPMVNWDVVNENWRAVQRQWTRLSST